MQLQNFVDKTGPVLGSAWLNQIDRQSNAYKVKQNQGARQNTIVLADDPELIWPVQPAGIYRVFGYLLPQCPLGSAGFAFKLRFGGGVANSMLIYRGQINNAPLGDVLAVPGTGTAQFATVSTGSVFDFIYFDGIYQLAEGDVALQWAQHSSNANFSVLNNPSWMAVLQVG